MEMNLLLSAIIFLPVSMTISGIFLVILLFKQLHMVSRDRTMFCPYYFKKMWLLFIIFSIFQGIFAINKLFHFAGLIGHYLLYWLILWQINNVIISIKDLKKVFLFVSISGSLLSIIAILTYFGFNPQIKLFYFPFYGGEYLINLETGKYIQKASGFAMNPNIMGCFLLITIFITISNFEFKETFPNPLRHPPYPLQRGRRDGDKNILIWNGHDRFLQILLILQTIGLMLTKSRGAIISCIIGLILLLFFKKFRYLIPVLIGFLFVFILNFEKYTNLLSTVFSQNYSTNLQRLEVWQTGLKILNDFPMGIGILNFENIYPHYLQANSKFLPHAHNWYLQTFIESGILGALTFYIFYFYLIYFVFKNLNSKYTTIPVTLLCFSIFNLTDYVLTDNRICILLTIIIFAGLKLYTLDSKSESEER